MKRHEIIYALRKYTHKADLNDMLEWKEDSTLEKYLNLMIAMEMHTGEVPKVRLVHVALALKNRPALT